MMPSVIREAATSGVVVGSAPAPGLTASAKTCCGHARQHAAQIEAWRIARDINPGRDIASEGDRPIVACRSECQHVGSRFDALATHGPIVAALGAAAPRIMNKVLDARTAQRGCRLEPAVATIDRRSPISGKEERPCCIGPLVEIARQDRHLMPELGETNGPFRPTSNSGPLAGSHANAERRIFSAASRSDPAKPNAAPRTKERWRNRKENSFFSYRYPYIMTRTDGGRESPGALWRPR